MAVQQALAPFIGGTGVISRVLLAVIFLIYGTVATLAQDLAETAELSELSKAMSSSGTLYVREFHRLPNVATLGGSSSIECEIVLVRIVDPREEFPEDNNVTVGLRLSIEEEYRDQAAYVDVDEAGGLLASLRLISIDGKELLASPLVDGITDTERSTEVQYTTREKTILAAFVNRGGNLRFAMKINSGADWAFLAPAGVDVLESNLARAVEVGRLARAQ